MKTLNKETTSRKLTTYQINPAMPQSTLLGYVVSALKAEGFSKEHIDGFLETVVSPAEKNKGYIKFIGPQEFFSRCLMEIERCNTHLLGKYKEELSKGQDA